MRSLCNHAITEKKKKLSFCKKNAIPLPPLSFLPRTLLHSPFQKNTLNTTLLPNARKPPSFFTETPFLSPKSANNHHFDCLIMSSKNRFWVGSDSDDDSSEDYSYSEQSEEEAPKKTQEKSKYVVVSESDSEEEKRVVKSPK